MKRIILILALSFVFQLDSDRAKAQQPEKVYRIGYMANASGIREDTEEVFRKALRKLGYIEGRNFAIEWRFSKGRLDLLPELAAELVRLKVDCIVAFGIAPTRAAKDATATIPIAMGNADDDPIRHGLVASLARPGGNVTGFTNIGSDLAGKRLEILKETVPRATRVAIFWDPKGPGGAGHAGEAKVVAPALGVELQPVEVRSVEDLENAFQVAVKGRAEALGLVTTGLMNSQRGRILNLAFKTRLPAMYGSNSWVVDGGLMGYDTNSLERLHGVASYVDKILKGVRPADLPVQQPTKFELMINLKTAKQINVTIPPNVLARADRVIR
jgi:putative tryptophan/tyrosine transport system substrate-binding protein